jgi:hypothetical protein
MNFSLYAEKKLRASGFHKLILRDFQNLIMRVRLEVDMGEHSASVTQIFRSCKTPLDYAKAYLRILCTDGLDRDAYGFDTREIFSPIYKQYFAEPDVKNLDHSRLRDFVRKIPAHQMDAELITKVLLNYDYPVDKIPDTLRVESLFDELIQKKPSFIRILEEKSPADVTEKLAIKAVSKEADVLYHLPEKWKTHAVSVAAFDKSPSCFYWIPKEFVTLDMARKAVSYKSDHICAVPPALIDYEMALCALSKSASQYRHIPSELLTEALYRAVLPKNSEIYKHVPDEIKKKPGMLEEVVVLTRGSVLKVMNYKEMTPEILKQCLDYNFMLMKDVPDHLFSEEIARHAVSLRGEAVLFLPSRHLTPDIIALATRTFPYALLKLDPSTLTPEMVMAAVKEDYKVFVTLPKALVTKEVLTEAIRQNGALLANVNEDARDAELCLVALTNGTDALKLIPAGLWRDRQFVLRLKELNPQALEMANETRRGAKSAISGGLDR